MYKITETSTQKNEQGDNCCMFPHNTNSSCTMLRSLSLCIVHVHQSLTNYEARRIMQQTLTAVSHYTRSLHLSAHQFSDDRGRSRRGRGDNVDQEKVTPLNAELKKAAIDAAKSLPGDWTKTAEELVKRLRLQQSSSSDEEGPQPEINGESPKSLLETMQVGRSFEGSYRRGRTEDSRADQVRDDDVYSRSSVRNARPDVERRSRVARRIENYDLNKQPRLGIFDANKLKKQGVQQLVPYEEDLWVRVDAENTRKALGALPRNAFEEMIQLTKEGKLWTFPIDNDSGVSEEEKKYKFHDHIFLERHLTEFPDKGPIRKFMELVALGLSMNSWITIPEKIEHIKWFAQYFREKQDILKASIGEAGQMKDSTGKLE